MTQFQELYQRYARDVYRFALYLSGDPSLADDISSETFIRAWTAPGEIRQVTVKAYLFTIAKNVYLKERQNKSRQQELAETIPDPGSSQQHSAEQTEEFKLMLSGLRILPELERTALLMRAQDAMSYEEIAAALHLSLPVVKVKIHRARLKLAEFMKSKEGIA